LPLSTFPSQQEALQNINHFRAFTKHVKEISDSLLAQGGMEGVRMREKSAAMLGAYHDRVELLQSHREEHRQLAASANKANESLSALEKKICNEITNHALPIMNLRVE
jgi:hypothetical protein